MSRKRGRPQRHYRIRVRTERRDPIDYAALAQAALEQAAIDHQAEAETPEADRPVRRPPTRSSGAEEPCDDRLA